MSKRNKYLHDVSYLSAKHLNHPFLRNAAIFVIGMVVGWFLLGWVLFPAASTDNYPNELHPEVINDYILMTAESYGATGDLRTAAKRLRYWEPEQLAAMLDELAQSVETKKPADAAYLRLLASDLHLSSPTSDYKLSANSARHFNLTWVIAPFLALAVLAILILIAQKFNWPRQETSISDEEEIPAEEAKKDVQIEQEEETVIVQPSPQPAYTITEDETSPESIISVEIEEDALDLPEESDLESEEDLLPEETDTDFSVADDFSEIEMLEAPDEIPGPTPPYVDETPSTISETEAQTSPPQVLRFDGDPAFNTIIAIEEDDNYLGEYGLSAGQTAPNNHNMVLTLEVWLFDKSDTQTTDITLAPPVVVNDPDLKARYTKENISVLPLQEGQIILLETAELRLEGRVRRVKYGGTTNDGVPIIEEAEIEMLGKRK